MRNTTRQV